MSISQLCGAAEETRGMNWRVFFAFVDLALAVVCGYHFFAEMGTQHALLWLAAQFVFGNRAFAEFDKAFK